MSRHEGDNSCDSLSIISNKLKVEVEILSEIVNLIKSNTYNGLSAILLKVFFIDSYKSYHLPVQF